MHDILSCQVIVRICSLEKISVPIFANAIKRLYIDRVTAYDKMDFQPGGNCLLEYAYLNMALNSFVQMQTLHYRKPNTFNRQLHKSLGKVNII